MRKVSIACLILLTTVHLCILIQSICCADLPCLYSGVCDGDGLNAVDCGMYSCGNWPTLSLWHVFDGCMWAESGNVVNWAGFRHFSAGRKCWREKKKKKIEIPEEFKGEQWGKECVSQELELPSFVPYGHCSCISYLTFWFQPVSMEYFQAQVLYSTRTHYMFWGYTLPGIWFLTCMKNNARLCSDRCLAGQPSVWKTSTLNWSIHRWYEREIFQTLHNDNLCSVLLGCTSFDYLGHFFSGSQWLQKCLNESGFFSILLQNQSSSNFVWFLPTLTRSYIMLISWWSDYVMYSWEVSYMFPEMGKTFSRHGENLNVGSWYTALKHRG